MPKKKNLFFTPEMDDELFDLMQEQANTGKRGDRGFKDEAYVTVGRAMSISRSMKITASNIRNRCKTLKKIYFAAAELLNASGFGFDKTTKQIIASEDVWKKWIEGHPNARQFKKKVINYDKLNQVFGPDAATKNLSRSTSSATNFMEERIGFTHGDAHIRSGEEENTTDQNRGDTSSRSRGSKRRARVMEEFVTSLQQSNEVLCSALLTAAEMISMPYMKLANDIATELLKITELSSLDFNICLEWFILNKDLAYVFLAIPNKHEWLLRRLPSIRQSAE